MLTSVWRQLERGAAPRYAVGHLLSATIERWEEKLSESRSASDDPRRIVVVDDDDSVREIVSRQLQNAGYDVVEAEGAVRALSLMRLSVPHLLITDMVMPVQGGDDLIRAVRSEHPSVRILAMSGGGGSLDRLGQAGQAGADRVLQKPFNRDQLLKIVTWLLSAEPPRYRAD